MGAVLLKPHAPADRWREEFALLCQAAEIGRLQLEAAEDAERIAYWQGVATRALARNGDLARERDEALARAVQAESLAREALAHVHLNPIGA